MRMNNTMRTIQQFLVAAIFLGGTAVYAADGYFDGETDLLCSVTELFECDTQDGCMAVTPDQVNGFSHFNLDFKNKVLTRAGQDSPQRTAIQRVEMLDGKLFLQGVDDGQEDVRDGAGWSISILNPEGIMTLATAADGFAIVALGVCVPKEN